MNRVILADENIPGVERYFTRFGAVRTLPGRSMRPGDLADVDVLLVRSVTQVNEELLQSSDVSFVGSATSGVEHIDQALLATRNIGFAAAAGANANSVVEYVLAAIANVGEFLERLLAGGEVGIVGYGAVGRSLAARCVALGIAHRIYDPWLSEDVLSVDGKPVDTQLENILSCDVICLHPELTDAQPFPSRHLLHAANLAGLSRQQLLINASRGAVIDNAALRDRLVLPDPPPVVLDVWEGEPYVDQGLLERVAVGTPHIAGYSLDAKLLATRMLRDAWLGHAGEQQALEDKADAELERQAEITVPEALDKAGSLRYLISQRYDILADDLALRNSLNGVERDAGAVAFDQLRKDYPVRRELVTNTVSVSSPEQAAAGIATALGCTVRYEG